MQAAALGQHRVGGQPHVVEGDVALDRGAHRQLRLDRGRGEARACRSGRRNPRMPSSVCAQMTATSAIEASPIQRLAPVSTQSVRRRRGRRRSSCSPGRCRRWARSARSSRSARPSAIPGSHRCFCSSEPNLWIALIASEPCTETKVRRPESPASSSIAARPYSTALAAGAAVALQVHAEQAEVAHLRGDLAREVRGRRTTRAMFGRIRSSTKARTLVPQRQFVGREQGVEVQVVVGPVADRGGRR